MSKIRSIKNFQLALSENKVVDRKNLSANLNGVIARWLSESKIYAVEGGYSLQPQEQTQEIETYQSTEEKIARACEMLIQEKGNEADEYLGNGLHILKQEVEGPYFEEDCNYRLYYKKEGLGYCVDIDFCKNYEDDDAFQHEELEQYSTEISQSFEGFDFISNENLLAILEAEILGIQKEKEIKSVQYEAEKINEAADVNEIQVSYIRKQNPNPVFVRSSTHPVKIFKSDWEGIDLQETMKAMLLNRRNEVIGIIELSKGNNHATIFPDNVFYGAVCRAMASSVILAHNHPSGNTLPSEADRTLTKKIKKGLSILGVTLLDHIIVTSESSYSFADSGRI